jgi:site-specific DNA recombinase
MSWKSAKAAGIVRVAIYTRFSSEMQSKESCDDQERECRERVAREPGWNVVLVEKDAAVRAGARAERAGLIRVLAAIERGDIDVLLVFEMSRFSRDVFTGMADLSILHRKKVGFADARGGPVVDLGESFGQMNVMFNLVISEQETARLGARSKYGLRGQVEKGFSSGGQAPYGYAREGVFSETFKDIDGHPKRIGVKFIPSEIQRPIVELIFRMYAEGCAKGSIARHLNETGVPTKRAGDLRAGRTNSGAWSTAGVKSILENGLYTGVRTWNRHSRLGEKLPSSGKKRLEANPAELFVTVPNSVEPLIDVSLWKQVQSRLRADAAEYAKNHTAAKGRDHLLSGFLVCGTCGARMILAGLKRRVSCYRCGLNKRGGGKCQNGQLIPAEALEGVFMRSIDVAVKDPKQLAALVEEHNRQVDAANEGQYSVIRGIEERLRDAKARHARFIEAIACPGGEIASLVAKVKESESDVAALEEQVAAANRAVQSKLVPRPLGIVAYQEGQASIFSGEITKDRLTIDRLVDSIVVSEGGQVTVHFRAEGLFGPALEHRIVVRDTDSERVVGDLAADRRRALASSVLAHSHARLMGRSAADIWPITQGGDVSYWLRVSKHEPSPDDDEDEPEADSFTRDIVGMGPVFPAVAAENTVCDPNGIRTCSGVKTKNRVRTRLWPSSSRNHELI